jgi:hypothetical protein
LANTWFGNTGHGLTRALQAGQILNGMGDHRALAIGNGSMGMPGSFGNTGRHGGNSSMGGFGNGAQGSIGGFGNGAQGGTKGSIGGLGTQGTLRGYVHGVNGSIVSIAAGASSPSFGATTAPSDLPALSQQSRSLSEKALSDIAAGLTCGDYETAMARVSSGRIHCLLIVLAYLLLRLYSCPLSPDNIFVPSIFVLT